MSYYKASMANRLYILSLSTVAALLAAALFIQIAVDSNNSSIQALGQVLATIKTVGGGKQEQISGQNHQQYLPVVENNLVPVQNTKDIALPFVSTTNQATKNL